MRERVEETSLAPAPIHPIKTITFGLIGGSGVIFLASHHVIPLLWAAAAILIILVLGQILRMQYRSHQNRLERSASQGMHRFWAGVLIVVEIALTIIALMLHLPALLVMVLGLALSVFTYRLIG